jgi:hypothetical protein
LEFTDETLPKVWERMKQEVGQILGAQLRKLEELPAKTGPNTLAIRVPAAYNILYEQLRMERQLEVLRIALRKILGTKDVAVSVELLAAPVLTTDPKPTLPPPSAVQGRRQEMLQLPFLKNAVSILGAQLMKAEDGFDPTAVPATAPAAKAADTDEEEESGTSDAPPPPDPDTD